MRFINGVLWFVGFTATLTAIISFASICQTMFSGKDLVTNEEANWLRWLAFKNWLWALLAWSAWVWLYTH